MDKCLTPHSASSACFLNAWIRRGRCCIDCKRRRAKSLTSPIVVG